MHISPASLSKPQLQECSEYAGISAFVKDFTRKEKKRFLAFSAARKSLKKMTSSVRRARDMEGNQNAASEVLAIF